MNIFLCYCDESELWDVQCGLVSCYDDVLCVAGCLDIVARTGNENTKKQAYFKLQEQTFLVCIILYKRGSCK
jgi:hypothetical protein